MSHTCFHVKCVYVAPEYVICLLKILYTIKESHTCSQATNSRCVRICSMGILDEYNAIKESHCGSHAMNLLKCMYSMCTLYESIILSRRATAAAMPRTRVAWEWVLWVFYTGMIPSRRATAAATPRTRVPSPAIWAYIDSRCSNADSTICVCACARVCVFACACVCICVCVWEKLNSSVHRWLCASVHMWVYARQRQQERECAHQDTHTHTYTITHTHNPTPTGLLAFVTSK